MERIVTVKMTDTQLKVLSGAMMDRKRNANPPLNSFGRKLHDDLLEAVIKQCNEVDLT